MRIGDYVRTSTQMINNINKYQTAINKSQDRLATGKKLSSDNPSSIGRGERLKSMINASRITQSSLKDAQLKNQAMDNTLSLLSESVSDLASLATESVMPGADTAAIEKQAAQMLDSMADSMANTKFNGSNPFTGGDTTITSNGGSTTFKTPEFNIAKNAGDPTKYDITLSDGTTLSAQSVTDILDSTYITKNLQTEVSNARSTVATNTNIMERHVKLEIKNEEIMTQSLENLEGIDLSKETVEMNKNTALLQINNQLLSATTGQFAQQIGNILDIRG